MKIKPILLAHFKQNGLTVYRSEKKIRMKKESYHDEVSPTIGEILSVSMPSFRIAAVINGKIDDGIFLGVNKYHVVYTTDPDEALKLVGIRDEAKDKINSWKRSLTWKKGEPVEKDWNFEVEAYEYSDNSWGDCTVEVSIPGQDILDVEIDLEYISIIATITFKDAEGYIQSIEQELNC